MLCELLAVAVLVKLTALPFAGTLVCDEKLKLAVGAGPVARALTLPTDISSAIATATHASPRASARRGVLADRYSTSSVIGRNGCQPPRRPRLSDACTTTRV